LTESGHAYAQIWVDPDYPEAWRNEEIKPYIAAIAEATGMPTVAAICREYRCATVTGDAYAGQTLRQDLEAHGIRYLPSNKTKHEIYESFEPILTASEAQLLDRRRSSRLRSPAAPPRAAAGRSTPTPYRRSSRCLP
jgi:hypothetical protein